MVDFRLKTFLAVWEEKGYTRASEKLGLTQSAVSQQVKVLENQLGKKLFSRKGRDLQLTEAGKLLYRYGSTALTDGEKTRALINALGSSVSLRFGATRTIGEYVLPCRISAYLRHHPEAELSMMVDNTSSLLEKLHRGEIDFALIEGIFDKEAYSTEVFQRDAFIPVCSSSFPLAGKTVTLAELLSYSLLVREKGSGSRSILEHSLALSNIALDNFIQVMEVGNIEAIKTLAGGGLGFAFLYEQSVLKELKAGILKRIDLSDFSLFHDFSFVTLKNSQYRAMHWQFIRESMECLSDTSDSL